ncbi:hypothetical protein Tco_0373826 [Tanacetum coccineum]
MVITTSPNTFSIHNPPILSPLPVSPPLPQIPSPPLLVSSLVPVLSHHHLLVLFVRWAIELRIVLAERHGALLSIHYHSTTIYSPTPDQSAPHQGHHFDIYSLWTVERIDTRLEGDTVVTNLAEFSQRMSRVWRLGLGENTNEVYTRLDVEHTGGCIWAGRFNLLFRG